MIVEAVFLCLFFVLEWYITNRNEWYGRNRRRFIYKPNLELKAADCIEYPIQHAAIKMNNVISKLDTINTVFQIHLGLSSF